MSQQHPSEIVQAFFANSPQKSFAKGELVLWPDPEVLPQITLLESGLISQYDITPSGDKVVVNIFKPGAFFPVPSAMNHTPNVYYFEAASDVVVRQRSAADVELMLHDEPAVVYDLLQRVYRGTDGLLGRLVRLLAGAADARVLYEIMIHADRFGQKQGDNVVIEVTAADLASQTGLARETVSRELQKLKEEGIIELARGQITLIKQVSKNKQL